MKARRRIGRRPTIFLDRDGTLIKDCDYLHDPKDVRLCPGVVDGLHRLQRARLPLIVVSNQSGVGRGLITPRQLAQVTTRFLAVLRQRGIRIRKVLYCPHLPSKRCSCRKPKLGLLKRASRQCHVPWRGGISIGDKEGDVLIGQRAGGLGVLVLTGYGRKHLSEKKNLRPDHVARNFSGAAKWILEKIRKDMHHGERN